MSTTYSTSPTAPQQDTTRAEQQRRLEQHIAANLSLLWEPGTVTEMAVFDHTNTPTNYGYFDDPATFAAIAAVQTLKASTGAVYLTPNPVKPELLNRSRNRLQPARALRTRTGDAHIVRRTRLWVDVDPKRETGIPATDAEHDAAIVRAYAVCDCLRDEFGFPDATIIASGNGATVTWTCDLPNDTDTTAAINSVYGALAARFNDPADANPRIEIDTSIGNPSRLSRVIGTMNRKGDADDDRRHRRVRVLEYPNDPQPVTLEMLRAVARHGAMPSDATAAPGDSTPGDNTPREGAQRGGGSFDFAHWRDTTLRPWCAENDGTIGPAQPWDDGGTIHELNPCPWNPDHARGEAFVRQLASGALFAGCHHASCRDKNWHALRDLVEPGWRAAADAAGQGARPSQGSRLVTLADGAGVDLFHTAEGQAYATVPQGGHRETWAVESGAFKDWLSAMAYRAGGGVPSGSALDDAVAALRARAIYDGPEGVAHLRIAEHAGRVYLDLCDAAWRVVEIGPDIPGDFRVIAAADAPVRFRRTPGMQALPAPVAGGSLNEFRPFVNVADADWPLTVGFVVGAMRPTGPYLHLDLHGEQGSAKSTSMVALRSSFDPHSAQRRAAPRTEQDLAIAANNNRVLTFDNLSGIKPWFADAACRIATGGALATRRLYTDDEEQQFSVMRPAIYNGIGELTSRPDLLDRTIVSETPRLARHRPEAAFWREFDAAHPRILGALCAAVAGALRALPDVDTSDLPRMADAVAWIVAAEQSGAFGWEPGRFRAAFDRSRQDAYASALEGNPVGQAVIVFLDSGTGPWEGTLHALLPVLIERGGGDVYGGSWPQNERGLGTALRRVAPVLRAAGVIVDFDIEPRREGGTGRARVRLSRAFAAPDQDAA